MKLNLLDKWLLVVAICVLAVSCQQLADDMLLAQEKGTLKVKTRSAVNETIIYPINLYAFSSDADCIVSQIVEDEAESVQLSLPAGKYRLSALIWSDLQGNTDVVTEGFYIYASTDGMEVQGTAQIDPSLASCFTPASVEIDVFNGELEVGFRVENTNANWAGVDNFELEYLGETSENVYDILA